MADCECKDECPFFNDKMKDYKGLAGAFKQKYCLGNNQDCARHMVFRILGKPAVPADLYPDMENVAIQIILTK